jgi:ferredoxin-NADP reductase
METGIGRGKFNQPSTFPGTGFVVTHLSMLKYLLDMRQPRDIVLLYANKTANEIAYKDILSEAQTQLGIRVFYTLTDTEAIPRNWRGLIGRIHEGMILKSDSRLSRANVLCIWSPRHGKSV